ncbi:glycosyl transferase [Haloarcula laminariae]|uniref:glycosyl transferase n=1 Tax=Haloarcula laminariae TaxID=2961577 RepID=UPI0021C61E12|nr:glycosyl transferase [Halomicroarcula laminariae]
MAIGGTRLDTPSAVGDEGRPRGASLTVVAVVVVAILAAAGYLVGRPLAFTTFGLFVGLTSAGMALLSRDRLQPKVLGHLLFLPAAVVLAALVGASGLVALASPAVATLVAGALVAMFGVAAGWNDAFDRPTVTTTLVQSGLSYLFFLVWLIVLAFVAGLGLLGWELAGSLARGAGPVAAFFGLFELLGVAAPCLYVAVRALPTVELAPAHRRSTARARYGRLKSALLRVTLVAWGAVILGLVGLAAGVGQALLSPVGGPITLLAQVTAIPLLAVAALALLAAVLAWAVRRTTAGFESLSTRTVGAAVAAVCYSLALFVVAPALLRLGYVGATAILVVPVLPLLVYVGLVAVLLGFYTGVLPGRAATSAVVAAGLVAMGLGGALYGFPSLFVFAAVAGGLVVWDVGTFGLGVTAELGHLPETRRLELYHGVVAVGVGLVGIAGLTVLDLARRSVGSAVGSPTTMGIAVLGVVLVAIGLRG